MKSSFFINSIVARPYGNALDVNGCVVCRLPVRALTDKLEVGQWGGPDDMLHLIAHGDHRLMRRLNRWPAPQWVRYWMLLATRGGDGWLWYAVGLLVLLFGGPDRWAATGAASLAAAVGIALFLRVKSTTRRVRPCELEPHCWAQLLPPDKFSFPSGHTITAFAVAVSFGLFYPSIAAGLLFCAGSVAASRIVLGMHFLSDVLAGAAIGTGLAYASVWLFRGMGQA